MPYLILLGLLVAGMLVSSVVSYLNSSKRIGDRLESRFGKPPPQEAYDRLPTISGYFRDRLAGGGIGAHIDERTWDDLDMDKVFARINACQTTVGEECLYDALRTPIFRPEPLERFEALLQSLDAHPQERLRLQVLLAKCGKADYAGLSSFIYSVDSKRLKRPWIYTVLAGAPIAALLIAPFNPFMGFGALIAFVVINAVVHYAKKNAMQFELEGIKYFASVLWCANRILRGDFEGLKFDKRGFEEDFKPFAAMAGNLPGMLQRGMSDLDVIAEYARMIFLTDLRRYNRIVEAIARDKERFDRLYRRFGQLDMAIATLSFRKSLPHYTAPTFADGAQLAFDSIYHPLIEKPVLNSANLSRSAIVTGSNASGKSTFIKAMAINGILAQSLHTCAAKRLTIGRALVVSSMAVRDDVTAGESYFITEIKSIKRMLDQLGRRPLLLFIDEILKGTNTVERIAASASVLAHIAKHPDCLCVVASHDIELTELMKARFDNYHFSEQITDQGVTFDYMLKPGPSRTRNAIRLLEHMAFDADIVDDANALVERFENTRQWMERD